ncbi:sulfite exporter TauE/SafE family protein [Flagellimonas meridianipacifica]|uniref:ABC-type nickel/cobalt efflux system permease component RcnA n=1 Tax=Flagellimonas meridianipacifica TaxID=1080225 RepID=A0A2T0MIS2_9FLAO|nr:sulfite exporter TauE/SafE family protein [Allomuricauda pacifica]PRX57488.1 ABC-type nickel/cobalt efflux system permease component RcnA [Allomuricauda pacifica]
MIVQSLFAGILASVLHVVSGPDHLAAITPLAIETRKRVWRIGLFWGFGHLTGMLVIGLLFLAFKEVIPVELISEYSEQLVGLVLIGVGIWAIFRIFFKGKGHKHPHIHGGDKPYIHVHDHNHADNTLEHEHTHSKALQQNSWSSFFIGVLHGLAGIAHFLLLLPVLGFESQFEGILYIIGFALGTVLAMVIYAYILGTISNGSKKLQSPNAFQSIRIAGGLFAIIIGVYWLYLGF